jgi:hypothetical protein
MPQPRQPSKWVNKIFCDALNGFQNQILIQNKISFETSYLYHNRKCRKVRNACLTPAGNIGNYEDCSFNSKVLVLIWVTKIAIHKERFEFVETAEIRSK